MKSKTILCFFDSDSGRDVQALAPIIYYLTYIEKFQVINEFFFETYKIVKHEPDMVLLPNSVGSREFHQILKDCYQRNIPAFSLTAEGNIKEEFYKEGINWGWNNDKMIYQDKLCLWSYRSQEMYQKYWPSVDSANTVVTGGSGFDIYRMAKDQKKHRDLFPTDKYEKTIGYAGWAFGKMYSPNNQKILKAQFKDAFEQEVDWRKKKENEMESILRNAIEKNPDFLFILKKHPKENSSSDLIDYDNEMSNLDDYPNVIYLRDEKYALYEIIGSCDVWTCFESTTILEAWLMGKPTINIKPQNENKYETPIAQGSLKAIDSNSFNDLLQKLRKLDLEELFENRDLVSNRNSIIQNSIGFSDGFNHLRVVKELKKSFEKNKTPNYSWSKMNYLHKFLMTTMKILTQRKFFLKFKIVSKHYFLFNTFDMKELNKNIGKYFESISDFYDKKGQEIQNFMRSEDS